MNLILIEWLILTYYGKFLPNLASNLTPLYSLLGKNKRWVWGAEQDKAFQQAKEALQADSLLVHFDPEKPLILACDACIGAVLSKMGRKDPLLTHPGPSTLLRNAILS